MFYIAHVSSLLDAQIALQFSSPGRPVHCDTKSTSLERRSHAAITREDYSLTFPPTSIARHSFIELSELGTSKVFLFSLTFMTQPRT